LTERVHNVRVRDLELDEVWSFVGCKQKRLTPQRVEAGMVGDAYTFIALERTSKLVVAWHLGKRDRINTEDFVSKIRWATAPGWFDVSTDAFQPYENAIDAGLYDRANHAQIVKLFSNQLDRVSESYKPARFVSVAKDSISGRPDLDRASTSHVERKNGTLRQWCKRLTRLTYAFSKKWENLRAALALHFAHYNFCRIHSSLRLTPAMEAGITDHVWTIAELLASCLEWLRNHLYPNGIKCKKCQKVTKHRRVASRPSYSCDSCGNHVHPTAGTIFHKSSMWQVARA
jgi:IS1 family transposase